MPESGNSGREDGLPEEVGGKAARRIRARQRRDGGVWFGLGMFGLVGWTVAIYTVLGVFLGLWLDRRWPLGFSWTLSLLLAGLAAGLLNAWHWISKESRLEDGPADDEKTKNERMKE